jgi:hypothetical protein
VSSPSVAETLTCGLQRHDGKWWINILDNDKFIELVRVRPVIWDIKSDDYVNRNVKKEAWNELLRLMINDFDSFSEQRKDKAIIFF